jgi:hypothetical protein
MRCMQTSSVLESFGLYLDYPAKNPHSALKIKWLTIFLLSISRYEY